MMTRQTLTRWLTQRIAGCETVRITTKGSDDEIRVIRAYQLTSSKDELTELAGELLADAQSETDIREVRCSFVIEMLSGEDKVIATIPLRCEPNDAGSDVPEQANADGLLALAMKQLTFAFRELGSAPARQRLTYDNLIEVLQKQCTELHAENKALRQLLGQSYAEDLELQKQLAEQEAKREARMDKLLGQGADLLKSLGGALMQEAIGNANGHAANGHDAGAGESGVQ
jgi:hypothetical protein